MGMMDYQIVRRSLILHVGDELDHHEAKKIKSLTDMIFRKGTASNIILDFSDTQFMDSAGIGMMISRYKETDLCGGKLCVLHASDYIRKLMDISGLHSLVYEYDSLEEALQHV